MLELLAELLKRPDTWFFTFSVAGGIASYLVVIRLLSIIKRREDDRNEILQRLRELAQCQTTIVSLAGLTHTQVLKLQHRLEQDIRQ